MLPTVQQTCTYLKISNISQCMVQITINVICQSCLPGGNFNIIAMALNNPIVNTLHAHARAGGYVIGVGVHIYVGM